MKRPSKETEHHYDDCHILIQYNFSVSESEFLFTPNFKSISVKIASLLKNVTLSLFKPKYSGLVILFFFQRLVWNLVQMLIFTQ